MQVKRNYHVEIQQLTSPDSIDNYISIEHNMRIRLEMAFNTWASSPVQLEVQTRLDEGRYNGTQSSW